MKILISGDWHGDRHFASSTINHAVANGCEYVIQVGDFGFWPRIEPAGPKFISHVEKTAADAKLRVIFLDGNHEDHEELISLTPAGGEIFDIGYQKLNSLYYAPRGSVLTLANKKLMFFGGAYSIDRAFRDLGYDWFHEEVPTPQQKIQAAKKGKVDILFTHDAPLYINIAMHMYIEGRRFFAIEDALRSRSILEDLVCKVKPKLLFHGHYHIPYVEHVKYDDFEYTSRGLAHNNYEFFDDTYHILDLDKI